MTRYRRRRGFSIVELFVVIGILGLLLGMLLTAIQRARAAADRAVCLSNMRQLIIGMQQAKGIPRSPPGLSWMVGLLPFIEESNTLEQSQAASKLDWRTYLDPPHAGGKRFIRVYCCPADGRLRQPQRDLDGIICSFSSYLGVHGGKSNDGFFGRGNPGFGRVSDGLSNTIILGERPPPDTFLAGRWYSSVYENGWKFICHRGPDFSMQVFNAYPVLIGGGNCTVNCIGPFRYGPGRTDNTCDRYHFWSLHGGGANFAFGDGSVRYLSYAAEPIMIALATCNGGEVVELPE
jgi:prepilin-type processing-associated H-X9-DG protein